MLPNLHLSLFPQMGWEQGCVSLGLMYLKFIKSKESFVPFSGFWMSLRVSIGWPGLWEGLTGKKGQRCVEQ